MSYAFFVLSVVGSAAIASQLGGRKGLWLVWFLALLVMPVWLRFEIGALRLDMRTGAAIGAVAGFLGRPEPVAWRRWLIADGLMAILVVSQLCTDYSVGEFGTFSIFEAARHWLIPYVIGRLFFATTDDIGRSLRPFCHVCVGISAFSMFEAVTKFHILNKALGKTFGILESGEGYRMGLKRSQGMTEHPIYFGLVLVLLFPFAYEAARQAKAKLGPVWWRLTPWLMGGALFATVSRGPQLAGIGTALIVGFFRLGRLRIPVLCLAIAAAVAGLSAKEAIINSLEAAAGESSEEGGKILMINGEEEIYSGTRHRVLLFKVYADYLATTGWFGYGNKMKAIVLDEDLAERFWSIDSHYVRTYLQRGYAGTVPFVLLQVWTLVHLGWLAWPRDGPRASLAAGLFGAMGGVGLTLFSVWFTPDFATVWIFATGLAANLVVLKPDPEGPPAADNEDLGPLDVLLPRRRLVPGHAPLRIP